MSVKLETFYQSLHTLFVAQINNWIHGFKNQYYFVHKVKKLIKIYDIQGVRKMSFGHFEINNIKVIVSTNVDKCNYNNI